MSAGSPTPRRLQALVAVARVYRLAPREHAAGIWSARCPGCPRSARGRSLVLRETPAGARFWCPFCGSHGSRLTGLQLLAEGAARETLRAELAAAVARHGAAARVASDRVADDLEICRCPLCEGTDEGREGDA